MNDGFTFLIGVCVIYIVALEAARICYQQHEKRGVSVEYTLKRLIQTEGDVIHLQRRLTALEKEVKELKEEEDNTPFYEPTT